MAVSERLPAERRAQIAEELGQRLRRRGPLFTEAAEYALAESLPTRVLDLDSSEGSSLADLCVDRGTWHHQVRQGSSALLVARSIEQGDDARGDLSLASSELAEKVDRAIGWADTHVSDDWTARLLFIPSLLTYALWFERGGEDRLYIIDSVQFAEGEEALPDEVVAAARAAARDWGSTEFELPG